MTDLGWLPPILSLTIASAGLMLAVRRWRDDEHSRGAAISQGEFRAARRYLKANRAQLSGLARAFYGFGAEIPGVNLIHGPGWVLANPTPFERVRFELETTPGVYSTTLGSLQEIWPRRLEGRRFESYAEAIRELDPVANYFNGPSYRLLGVATRGSELTITVGVGHYFDFLNTAEAFGFEFARDTMRNRPRIQRSFRIRRRLGDPFALTTRCASIGISAVTLVRRPVGVQFWMHQRDGHGVASAQDTEHVIPAGEFQPTSVSPVDLRADLSLWRNVQREFVEEFRDREDLRGERGRPLAFDETEWLRALEDGRRRGDATGWVLGLGIDPLTLKAEVLAALVIDGALFDQVAGSPVIERNSEGLIEGPLAFTGENVRLYTDLPTTLPAGVGVLSLAWTHREIILGQETE